MGKIKIFFVMVILSLAFSVLSQAADLQVFENAKYINNPANDGDSFIVDVGKKRLHARLYFVDCPETHIKYKSSARRVREQTRYFGLSSSTDTVYFGRAAKSFVKNVLGKPFTLYTSHANARGVSGNRVYAFVITSEKEDLAALLVKNGLARVHGVGRKLPGGDVSRGEMFEILRDFEASAMLKGAGAWAKSDSDKIADYRSKQRKENKELEKIISGNDKTKDFQELFNPNTASAKELQSIKGIGPVTAKRIIAGRPYESVDELIRVKGIGPKKLKRFRRYFTIIKK